MYCTKCSNPVPSRYENNGKVYTTSRARRLCFDCKPYQGQKTKPTQSGSFWKNDARAKRKKRLIDLFGGKCSICGYDRCTSALEFHHIDKKTKKFGISGSGLSYKWETLLEEAKKCILICSNCHREKEESEKEINQPPLIRDKDFGNRNLIAYDSSKLVLIERQSFEHDLQQHGLWQLSKLMGLSYERLKKFCNDHKIDIPKIKAKRKNKFEVSFDELTRLVQTMSLKAVGRHFGVSDNAIRKRCIKMGIQFHKSNESIS